MELVQHLEAVHLSRFKWNMLLVIKILGDNELRGYQWIRIFHR